MADNGKYSKSAYNEEIELNEKRTYATLPPSKLPLRILSQVGASYAFGLDNQMAGEIIVDISFKVLIAIALFLFDIAASGQLLTNEIVSNRLLSLGDIVNSNQGDNELVIFDQHNRTALVHDKWMGKVFFLFKIKITN